MLPISKPQLTTKTITELIKSEMPMSQYSEVNEPVEEFLFTQLLSQFTYLQTLVANAESFSQNEIQWPAKLNFFPFNLSILQKIILKVYSFIFKKQAVINNSLIQGLKTSININEQLVNQLNTFNESLGKISQQVDLNKQNLSGQEQIVCSTQQQVSNNQQTIFSTQQQVSNNQQTIFSTQQQVSNNQQTIFSTQQQVTDNQQIIFSTQQQVTDNQQIIFDTREQIIGNEADNSFFDGFYLALEDQFRGSQEEVTDKLKVYLPFIEKSSIETNKAPILDVGCGRGEWIDLLQKNDYDARGIDLNRIMVQECQDKGLDVIHADVIEHLKSLPDECLGGITGFHIIEHLPFNILMQLFTQIVRVLKTGAIVILETPNPENVLVGANKFYIDPTHLHPLPSKLIEFVAQFQGLSRVQILNLNPYPENVRLEGSELAQRLNQHFYSEQDYSIIGYKE